MRILALSLFLLLPSVLSAQSWCSASRLNATEQTICAEPLLGELDTELAALFRASSADNKKVDQSAWLRGRNGCGSDFLCILNAYTDRISELQEASREVTLRRPWCSANRLNATERAICGDDTLANLDAAMAKIYGSLKSQDALQDTWLRNDRNTCGGDAGCIGEAYLRRIIAMGEALRMAGS